MFGYYMLASVVAMSLSRLITPVFISIYPRFTQLVSLNDQDGLIQLYHKSCQFMAVLILPVAIVIAFYSYEILLIWTQNPTMAEKSHLIVSVLIFGTALNGLMNLPYVLQLAFGWTKLSVIANIIAVILFVPLMIYMAMYFGAIGAASVWLLLNVGYILFEIPIMHRRILCKEMMPWYWHDVCMPLMAVIFFTGLSRILISGSMPQILMLFYLSTILVLSYGIAIFTTPATRSWLFEQFIKIKSVSGN
jgi:O-antigen/teichoic acid export membrane protein